MPRSPSLFALALGGALAAHASDEPAPPTCEADQELVYTPSGEIDPERAVACQA